MGSGSSKNDKKTETQNNAIIQKAEVCTPKSEDKHVKHVSNEDMFRAFKAEQKAESALKAEEKTDTGSKTELPWRQALDKVEAMEIWEGKSREQRSPWKEYLQKADEILKKPRKAITKVCKSLSLVFSFISHNHFH